jgi:predicted phosphodiesterase
MQSDVLFEDVCLSETTSADLNDQPQPNIPQVAAYATEPQEQMVNPPKKTRAIYCVSDLHLGNGGPRDNFAHMNDCRRAAEFDSFLDFVEKQNGQLLILGDLFELWQSNMSEVLAYRIALLDRLATMGAIYVLGNHDADLLYFISPPGGPYWLTHPFFRTMCRCHRTTVAGRTFRFVHGHDADPFWGDAPGLGRITAIYTGLKEDRNGSPLRKKYPTVEARTLCRLEWPINFIRRLCGLPDRVQQMNRGLCKLLEESGDDVLVAGHTHLAGKVAGWGVYNCGTWAEQTCSFVVINQTASVGVFDWVDHKPVPNGCKLFV